MVRIAFAVVFSQFGGWLLTGNIEQYRWLLAAFALSLGAVCYCLTRIPSDPLAATESSHPLRALRHVRDDRLFRQVLISWMLMGFGNLITLPLAHRVPRQSGARRFHDQWPDRLRHGRRPESRPAHRHAVLRHGL
jgi:hypothetical protein